MSGADDPEAVGSDAGGGDEGTDRGAVPTWTVNGLLLSVLWLFVRGVELAPARLLEEWLIGLAVGLPVAFALRRFYSPGTGIARSLRVAPFAVLYLAVFVRDVVVANFDVAWRVVAPSMPIEPAVVEVPLRVRSDLAVTTIANSITLTPGTLTMDYDRDANALYVHSIDGSDPESVVDPIRTWEEYALVIFDEELKPGDPVPEPGVVRADAEGSAADGDGGGRDG